MPSTALGGRPPAAAADDAEWLDSLPSWQSSKSTAKCSRPTPPFPVIINHSSPKSIKKVLAANTVPKSTTVDNDGPKPPIISCLCCVIEVVESRRLRNCLYATAFVPASMLCLLLIIVWLNEFGLI